MTGALLGLIGYSAETAFEPAVTEGIFNLACLIPTGGFILLAAALWFFYPLNKNVEDNAKTPLRKQKKQTNKLNL